MTNMIVGIVILAVVTLAAGYLIRAKKKGAGCIGCPHGGKCHKACGGKCREHCT